MILCDWQNTAAVSICKAAYLIQAMTDTNLIVSFWKKNPTKNMKNDSFNRFRQVIKKVVEENIVSDQVLFGWTHPELTKDRNGNRNGDGCSFH